MRYLSAYLLGVVVVTAACQPHAPADMSLELAGLEDVMKAAGPAATRELTAKASNSKNQDDDQTDMELAIIDITSVSKANPLPAKSASVAPQIVVVASKNFNPTSIIGFEISALVRDLGHATIIRQEGQIEIWQYQFASCVIDFFFYPFNESTSKLLAKSWDMRSAMMGNSLDRTACLAEVNIYHQNVLTNS